MMYDLNADRRDVMSAISGGRPQEPARSPQPSLARGRGGKGQKGRGREAWLVFATLSQIAWQCVSVTRGWGAYIQHFVPADEVIPEHSDNRTTISGHNLTTAKIKDVRKSREQKVLHRLSRDLLPNKKIARHVPHFNPALWDCRGRVGTVTLVHQKNLQKNLL